MRSTACGRTAQTVHSTTDMNNEEFLGGGFKYFWFSPLFGQDFQFDKKKSDGWKGGNHQLLYVLSYFCTSTVLKSACLFVFSLHVFSHESRREILSVSNFEVETSGYFGLEVFVLPVPPKSVHSLKLIAKALKMDGWKIHVPFGMVFLFRCYVFSC